MGKGEQPIYFEGDMKYAFSHLETKPYEDSWLGYLIT
jgi:hypothetical protein